ncbi:MAG: hypothetical protein WD061_00930 [Candidatus Saccharimonadales bacterium]
MAGNSLRIVFILALLVLVLGLGAAMLGMRSGDNDVNDYDSCIAAGHSVAGSAVCTNPDTNTVYYKD